MNSSSLKEKTPLDNAISTLNLIYPIPVCLLASLGNLFIFLIYAKSPSLHKITTGFFIRVQTVCDVLACYLGILRYFILGVANISVKDSSVFLCKSLLYLIYVVNFCSAWLLVATSIDRLIFILNYSKVKFLTKRPFQIAITCVVVSAGFLLYLPRTIYYELVPDKKTKNPVCLDIDAKYRYMINIFDMVFNVVLPFLVLLVTMTMLTLQLYKSKQKFSKPSSLTTLASLGQIKITVVSAASVKAEMLQKMKERAALARQDNNNNANNGNIGKKHAHSNSFHFSMTLLVLIICFLIANFPASLINIIKSFANINTVEINFIYTLATILRYSYVSFSFFAHFGSNRIFRKAFVNLVRKRKFVDH